MPNDTREIALSFGDISGGKATSYPQNAIAKNQCYSILNLIVEKKGFSRAPGYAGLQATAMFAARMRGLANLKLSDGTEVLIAVSGSKVYSVNASTAEITEVHDFGTAAETYAVNYGGKLFVCNGYGVCKIESSTVAYRVGIVAPTGATAAAVAGGSLPVGAYKVAVSYARKVGAVDVLYSEPQIVSTVTLSAGNLSVEVTIANSADTQVGNKVVWMTDADGAVYYYYGATGNNTSPTITITSASARNAALNMAVEAVPNQVPPNFVNCYAFDNRLFGWVVNSNILIYSMKSGTAYDLERYPNYTQSYGNRIVCPFNIVCLNSVGSHLFVNTTGGTYALPNGDITAKLENVENYLYFKYPKTVQEYGGYAWGVTNDGFRFFDGARYSADLAKHIKPDIDTLNREYHVDIQPQGIIHRRSGKRTEYHLVFRDSSISDVSHSRHLVLNVDQVVVVDNANYNAPWEEWSTISGFLAVSGGTLYTAQTIANAGTVIKEDSVSDNCLYDSAGVFVTAEVGKVANMTSRLEIPDMAGMCKWVTVRLLSKANYNYTVTLFSPENNRISSVVSTVVAGASFAVITETTGPLLPFILPLQEARTEKLKQPRSMYGKSVYIVFEQGEVVDENLQIFDIQLNGFITRSLQV